METSTWLKSNPLMIISILLLFAMATVMAFTSKARAGILVQTNSGAWVDINGFQFSSGYQTMPGIIINPEVRGSSFMMQRATAWASYRRPHSATGFLLLDPMGTGVATATTPRQAAVRSHVARANAYRLEYFKK